VLSLGSLPLGATSSLLSVVPSLGVLVELSSPSLRQRRTIGRRLVGGLGGRGTVSLRSRRAVLLRSGSTVSLRSRRTVLLRRSTVTRRAAVLLLGMRRCVSVVAVGAVSVLRRLLRRLLLLLLLFLADTKVLKLLGDLLEERHDGRLQDEGKSASRDRNAKKKTERGR
jgi:hypothetical protein